MKKGLLKLYILGFVLFSDFVLFAQPSSESDEGDPLEDEDAPQAPINGKMIWLALVGILFAFYIYKTNRKAKA